MAADAQAAIERHGVEVTLITGGAGAENAVSHLTFYSGVSSRAGIGIAAMRR